MSFKLKSFWLIILLYTSQISAQQNELPMPTIEQPLPTSLSTIPENSEFPNELPSASQAPVMISVAKEQEIPQISKQNTNPAIMPQMIPTMSTSTSPQTETLEMPTTLEMPSDLINISESTDKKTSTSIQSTENKPIENIQETIKQEKPKDVLIKEKQKPQEGTLSDKELDFEVENKTGKTIYVTCFSYVKKRPFSRWRWDKSSIYKIEDNKNVIVNLDTIIDDEDRTNTFGYLAVFENEKDAEDSTFQLLDDNRKIDLDIIAQLKDKKVIIEIEKYGIAGEFYDYDFASKKKDQLIYPELDFYVENKTGKPVWVTCFVYEKKAKGDWLAQKTKESWIKDEDVRDDMSVWRFDKTPVIKIQPNESSLIDVDTIVEIRDRIYVRGCLAVFDEDEKEEAEKSTYELLPARRKLDLARLVDIKDKKISIYTERYGVFGNFIDYVTKPTQKPNITPIIKGYFK